VFPFIEDGIVKEDVFSILTKSVGIPEYYKWRSRSGCYFCFFQRQDEWLGLKRNHPALFEQAKAYEARERKKYSWKDGEVDIAGRGYTWSSQGSLDELVERAEKREKELGVITTDKKQSKWQDIMNQWEDDDAEDQACLICSL
jgi:hypothetical protein